MQKRSRGEVVLAMVSFAAAGAAMIVESVLVASIGIGLGLAAVYCAERDKSRAS